METFKEKLGMYKADRADKAAHHFMHSDPSRHGMHMEDYTNPRKGVVPMRHYKTGGHVAEMEEDHEGHSPTGKIGRKVNEAILRTSHKRGGHTKHKDFGGLISGMGQALNKGAGALGNAAGVVTKPARNAMSSFGSAFQGAKHGGKVKKEEHKFHEKACHRAMGGAGKVRKNMMTVEGKMK